VFSTIADQTRTIPNFQIESSSRVGWMDMRLPFFFWGENKLHRDTDRDRPNVTSRTSTTKATIYETVATDTSTT
jgi:hypothetical protein